ncbi:hypothetical protein CARUB_v10018148mg [Capsella rubella]|uniref:Uncharacterized protein n=1 Tax=Capsella rubella TaxID=81985 RepID=R0FQM0_9BRAS|nr:uncharacterized protein LOC17886643 [Capsella rubella]EOA24857.1 hypothetical protein CARUB_v10018148mg [Capsella rubella]
MEESLTRTDSVGKKRVREDELCGLDSPDVKRLRDDLFDDSGNEPAIQDLDSVMKSFEDELSNTTTVQGSGETQPDLGYLFEASDDELGLPPPVILPSCEETVTELVRVSSDSSDVGELCGFGIEDHVTDFGTCDLGDGLFEYSDVCLDSGDLFSWRQEFLPAE